jgi:putative lipoic acid-binding regulatory protein
MESKKNPEEFYDKLKFQLEETTTWPSVYLYKFIVFTSKTKIVQIHAIFDDMGAVINTKESKNGKYTSVSINVRMKNPDSVIAKYKRVGKEIEGVISL